MVKSPPNAQQKKGGTAPLRKAPNFFGAQTVEDELMDLVRTGRARALRCTDI